jgi:predicted ATPase/DNA-binding CsgD family transcriptional regulator
VTLWDLLGWVPERIPGSVPVLGVGDRDYLACVPQLSRRETEVAKLVANGLTNRQIAERLFLSERTAEYHVEQIRNKLGFHSRAEIATWLAGQSPAAPPPSNLPALLTTFIGRAREIAAVRTLLGRTRLVTITGAPGTGKTRLSLELAAHLRFDFRDGIWFVNLQGLTDRHLVASEVAATLGVSDPARDLTGKQLLVLLDNCEHLVSGCAHFAQEVLGACPEVRLLATSRQPLHVLGEGVWQLEPLPGPDAAELFLERARLAAPEVDLAAVDPTLLESICGDLDGIPLAIELAAARTRVMSLADIRERLKLRFSLLTSVNDSLGERQGTLESTVAWSYNLLSDKEQLLFRRLGVFAGAFFLESASAVVADSHLLAGELPELIDRLVDRSIVIAERAPDRKTRYRLLVTLRDYGRDRLRDEGALERLRGLHGQYYRHLAEEAGAELQGPRQVTWLKRLEDELDEIRAAIEWGLAADHEAALVIAGELGWFWGLRGRVNEGRRALAAALPLAPQRTLMRGRALIAAGWLARLQGDLVAGPAFHAESVDILRALDDPVQLAMALVWNAESGMGTGDWITARAGLQEAVELVEPRGPSEPLAYGLLELAMADVHDGLLRSAHQHAAEATVMHSTLSNRRGVAMGHLATAYVEHLEGNGGAAWTALSVCIRTLREVEAIGDLSLPFTLAVVVMVSSGGPMAKAVTLGGAAAALDIVSGRQAMYTNLMWSPELPAALSSARNQLGAEAYEAAWQAGLRMTADEAVAYALG